MSFQDPMQDRGRALEEEYFRKRDRELVEKMRAAAEANDARKALGDKTGLTDPAVLAELQELGFTPETAVLLPIVPVLQVAWAEGGVTKEERTVLLTLAKARGITEGSAAHAQLLSWMDTRPDAEVFARAGRLIAALLAAGGEAGANLTAADLVAYCEKVAGASGGIFGLGRVSVEEKQLLASIASDLQGRK
jgi:hypothetical protein